MVLLVLPLRPRLISIHALREEGDEGARVALEPFRISIHALREEGDQEWADKMGIAKQFLSTPSARRATYASGLSGTAYQSISIHALREEGDRRRRL